MKPAYVVSAIMFESDGTVSIQWLSESDQDDDGGLYHTSVIYPSGQEADQRVRYYVQELREDVDELLDAWLKHRKGT